MTPTKVIATIGSNGTLTLDHLPYAAGAKVEVLVNLCPPAKPDDPTEGRKYPLRGTVLHYPDPFGPAWDADEWEDEG